MKESLLENMNYCNYLLKYAYYIIYAIWHLYILREILFSLFFLIKIKYNYIMKNIDLINDFINYLKVEKNYSDKTIKSYEEDLNSFVLEINKNLLDIKEEDIIEYLKILKNNKYKKTSVSRKISSLKNNVAIN